MALLPPVTGHDRDRQIAKRPDHAFGGRLRGGLGTAGGIQPDQWRTLILHGGPQPLFGQHQHAQGQAQQPDQARDAGFVAQKDRTQVQIARFEAAEGALMHRLLVIGGDQGRYVVLLGGRITHVDLPAQPINQRLPCGQVNPDRRNDPGGAAIASGEGCQRRLHHPRQFGRRNPRGHYMGQIGFVRIAFAPAHRLTRQLQQIGGQAIQRLLTPLAHPRLIGGRADDQHALRPGVRLLRRQLDPGLGALHGMDHRVQLQLARAAVDRLDPPPGRRVGQGVVHPSRDFGGGVAGAIGTHIAASAGDHVAARGQVDHFAVADHQHRMRAHGRDGGVIRGDVQAVIAGIPSDGLATDRQSQRVERGQHKLELAQIGPMLFAVAMLEQAIVRNVVMVDADAGAVQAHRVGGQAIDAHSALEQGRVERGLRGRIAEQCQADSHAVIGAIGIPQRDVQQCVERLDTIRSPFTHRHQAMVAFLQDVAQPNAQDSAHTCAFPVTMRWHMRIDQIPNAHIGDDTEQQRQAIDLLVRDSECWCGHAARIPQHHPNLASQIRES